MGLQRFSIINLTEKNQILLWFLIGWLSTINNSREERWSKSHKRMEKNQASAWVTSRNQANQKLIFSPKFWMLSKWNSLAFWIIMQTLKEFNVMLSSLPRKLVLRLQTARLNSVQNQFQFRMLLSQASWTLLVKSISKKMYTNNKIHSQH